MMAVLGVFYLSVVYLTTGALSSTGLAAAGDVGHLDLADERRCPAQQLDQVSFANLRVIDVEHHPQSRPVHRLHQRQRVLGPAERNAGMIDGSI